VNPLVRLYYLAEYAAAQTLLQAIALLPLRPVLGVAEMAARVSFLLLRRRRRIAIENILGAGICARERDARRIALAAFRTFFVMLAEANIARQRFTARNWADHVTLRITGEAEAALRAPGQGLLVATAHFGNWEVMARGVSMIKPVCAVYRPFKNPYLDELVSANRSGANLRFVSRKLTESPTRLIRALAAGEILAIMMDQHAAKGRVLVDFFGRKAWTTKSVAMLHLTVRCPLLLAFALRTGPLRYEVHAIGPIEHERTGDRERDVRALTQRLTQAIEAFARAHPEQYMWGHRRWKVRPEQVGA
jgi:Kdo2-lipid IVA lauroyltransferase/acyltransferase